MIKITKVSYLSYLVEGLNNSAGEETKVYINDEQIKELKDELKRL